MIPDQPPAEPLCPLCGRPLGTANIDRHHLVPKTFKGRAQFPIHKICHRKIHSVFTEKELFRTYHTWDKLRENDDIRTFIEWVARRAPEFYTTTATANSKKRK
jgi:5-methylcytosine-specific restriction endonuclease McrA